ncbi:TniB family NTP-binding protein [Sphingomonas oryzagri]|uniref:TniB family NTP-binding protein n=1 Tax=Sphingomonas oryzagri TaxID=3042314 RepID=A0ABT6N4E9_9SPHN|nr:TniB family NTP-binding protein [Sphingomonas oryzagri]MDH7639956.1 TniB family NTP-binding protein [Sphingomonas oryzagri]
MSAGREFRGPATGRALSEGDDAATARETAAWTAYLGIDVEHAPQKAIKGRIEAMRQSTLGIRGRPLPGLRLSQVSQAGKTWTLKSYIAELKTKTAAATGLSPHPHQAIYIGLKKRTTVKMLFQNVLAKLGDPHVNVGNVEILEQRCKELLLEHGVQLLFVDEVQHLLGGSQVKEDVTDQLKTFMDEGLVPIVMAGNERSREFFEANPQLAGRLGTPLELAPATMESVDAARAFATFCDNLDQAMVDAGCVRRLSGLGTGAILARMVDAATGHVGRVHRIVEEALRFSARRGADFVEEYDLSYSVRHFAIPNGWVDENPFAEPDSW